MAPGGRRGLRSRLDWIDREKKRVKYWGEFVRKNEVDPGAHGFGEHQHGGRLQVRINGTVLW